jgi:PIN domain nuclease of toxin-antitoxin system
VGGRRLTSILLDTHVWAWSLDEDHRFSVAAFGEIRRPEHIYLSAVSIFEIAQKARLGKWPQMAGRADDLLALLTAQGATLLPLDGPICLEAGRLVWDHRDPFDRMIAATALGRQLTLVSADTAFDSVVKRVW